MGLYVGDVKVDAGYVASAIAHIGIDRFMKLNPWFTELIKLDIKILAKSLRLAAMDAADEALFNMKTAAAYHWKDFVRDRRAAGWTWSEIAQFSINEKKLARRRVADSARGASPTGEGDPVRMLARAKKLSPNFPTSRNRIGRPHHKP